jgi:hypothetical protein
MELQRLAAKQKRYHDIKNFAQHEVQDALLRSELDKTLQSYKRALADCWSKQTVNAEDVLRIDSIERTLDNLHNEARLRARPA